MIRNGNNNLTKKIQDNDKILITFIEEIKLANTTNNNDLKLFLNNLEKKIMH